MDLVVCSEILQVSNPSSLIALNMHAMVRFAVGAPVRGYTIIVRGVQGGYRLTPEDQ